MKSSAVAPKRSAIAASWITSPAFTPTIETPSTRRVGRSSTILMTPRVSRMAPARGTTLIGMVVHWQTKPCAFASRSVSPTTPTCGSVKIARGITEWSTLRLVPSSALLAAMPPSCAPTGVAIWLSASRPITSPAAEIGGIRPPSGRHQQLGRLKLLGLAAHKGGDAEAAGIARYMLHLDAGEEMDPFFTQDVSQCFADLRLIVPQDAPRPFQNRDLGPQPREQLSQLQRDVAAAQNDQRGR